MHGESCLNEGPLGALPVKRNLLYNFFCIIVTTELVAFGYRVRVMKTVHESVFLASVGVGDSVSLALFYVSLC